MKNLLLALLLLCGSLRAQVVQYGKVVEWATQAPTGSAISGVSLTVPSVHDGQPTISDSKGNFRLCFKEHQVGDVIRDITAKKIGYGVVNVHVTRSWTLTTADTLDIIMAPQAKLKEARTRYYGLSRMTELNQLWTDDGQRAIEVESQLFSFHIGRYGEGMAASDVDTDIPTTNTVNDKMFAVIIANEYYDQEQDVPFAIHDGETFREYCRKTLGIPDDNIHFVTNATLNHMRFEVDWLSGVLEAHRDEARGIFYYAGHGIPDEVSRNAYLMPVDGYMGNLSSGFRLNDLYAQLGGAEADAVFYFIDACFSGVARDGDLMAQSRSMAVNSKRGVLQGQAVAFTAAHGDEAAYAYQEKSHGLFSYYLFKKLQETEGDITLGALAEYLSAAVPRRSAEDRSKSQHPTVVGTIEAWEQMKLMP